jgi:hypothetical protein
VIRWASAAVTMHGNSKASVGSTIRDIVR